MVQACLTLLKDIDSFPVAVDTVHVSGTVVVCFVVRVDCARVICSDGVDALLFLNSSIHSFIHLLPKYFKHKTGSVRTCKAAALRVLQNGTQKLKNADKKSILGMQY